MPVSNAAWPLIHLFVFIAVTAWCDESYASKEKLLITLAMLLCAAILILDMCLKALPSLIVDTTDLWIGTAMPSVVGFTRSAKPSKVFNGAQMLFKWKVLSEANTRLLAACGAIYSIHISL